MSIARSIEEGDVVVHSRLCSARLVDLQVPMGHTRFVIPRERAIVDAELACPVSTSENAATWFADFLVSRTDELLSSLKQVIGA